MSALDSGTEVRETAPSIRDRNRADRSRRQFSVLCWRGWCDHDFKVRDVAVLVSFVTVRPQIDPVSLPRRECPTPDTCQCVCHDAPPDHTPKGD